MLLLQISVSLYIFCDCLSWAKNDGELVQLNILYRHGDRSPTETFPTNPIKESAWPQGFGQLSQVGMYQHYQLGQYLRRRYIEGYPHRLLSTNYSRYEITIRSTDYDRTLMSAYSNLAGLYPPAGSQVWNPKIDWQPIPVHTVALQTDNLLYMEALCPKYDAEYEKVLASEEVQKEEIINKPFYDFIDNVTGFEHDGIRNIWKVYDPLFCEKIHGFSLPPWVNDTSSGVTAFEKLRILKDYGFQLEYNQPILKRLRGGTLLGAIVNNMKSRVKRTSNDRTSTKCFVYSAHDSTVAAFTSALNVFNNIVPPYATAVLIELIKMNETYFVKVLYRNDSTTDPYDLIVPGCTSPCPIDLFVNLVQSNIPSDWNAECQSSGIEAWIPSTNVAVGFIMAAVIGLIVLISCVVIVSVLRCQRRRILNRYNKLDVYHDP